MIKFDRRDLLKLSESLSAAKSAIEFESRHTKRQADTFDADRVEEILLELERMRLLVRLFPRKRTDFEVVVRDVQSGLQRLLADPITVTISNSANHRLRGLVLEKILEENKDRRVDRVEAPALVALQLLNDLLIERLVDDDASASVGADIDKLRRLIPEQKIAPVTFTVRSARIAILHKDAEFHEDDASNIAQARDALVQSSDRVISELSNSNCDRRLLESVSELRSALSTAQNIVHLGIMNIGCESMRCAFENELPSAVHAMLKGVTAGVAMYVAQFPEWQQFTEKAAQVEINQSDIEAIDQAAAAMVDELTRNPSLADPEVPKTIAGLRELLSNPGATSKRAAFAVLRTLENLVSKIFQYGVSFLEKTASKISDDLSGAISKSVIGALLAVALTGAANLSGLSTAIGESAWMKTAAEIVKRHIETLGTSN